MISASMKRASAFRYSCRSLGMSKSMVSSRCVLRKPIPRSNFLCQSSGHQGIDNLDEWEPVEVHIACADAANAVLPHEDSGVRIVQDIAGQERQFAEDLRCYVWMALGR